MLSPRPPNKLSVFSPGVFRLALACIVFAQHSTRIILGSMAVFLFFALSGYWINRMWEDKYSKTQPTVPTFYISRLWRLLPAFWCANLFAIVLTSLHGALPAAYRLETFSWHTIPLLAGNALLIGYASLPHASRLLDTAWSLDVEIQFYLIFPLLMWLAPRWRNLILLIVGAAGLAAITFYGEPLHRNILYYAAFFTIGMLAEEKKWVPRRSFALMGLAVAAVFVVTALALPQTRDLLIASAHTASGQIHRLDTVSRQNYTANCVLAFLLLPFALYTTAVRSGRTDRMLGDLSYLVYLFHLPLIALVLSSENYKHAGFVHRLPYFTLVWFLSFAVSAAFWRFVHLPLDKLRRNFVESRESAEEVPARDASVAPLTGSASDYDAASANAGD